MSAWIGVDLDGTLAHYEGWVGPEHIGLPIPKMLERVKRWLLEGKEVRIFTARVWPLLPIPAEDAHIYLGALRDCVGREAMARDAAVAIRAWCRTHLGRTLAITCQKDMGMVELWDDRVIQVERNTGECLVRPPAEDTVTP